MSTQFDLRRTLIYLGFAYGIAILAMAVIALNGGLDQSPVLFKIGPVPVSLALLLLATVYMYAPTYSHILTRIITREGWEGVNLQPQFRRGWGYWLLGFFHPIILTVLGAGVFFAIFPQHFDPQMTFAIDAAEKSISQSGQVIPREALFAIILTQALIGILGGALFNCLFTFGEEFGWRSYLLMKLMPLGWRKAMLLMGVIWGTWHWPILAFGYNYGLDIPGAPWSGMLAFIVFTWAAGTVLAWLSLRGGSVWPAVIGHGAINAGAGLGILFSLGEPNKLLGPLPFGLIAVIPWALVALWLLLRPGSLGETPVEAQTVEGQAAVQSA